MTSPRVDAPRPPACSTPRSTNRRDSPIPALPDVPDRCIAALVNDPVGRVLDDVLDDTDRRIAALVDDPVGSVPDDVLDDTDRRIAALVNDPVGSVLDDVLDDTDRRIAALVNAPVGALDDALDNTDRRIAALVDDPVGSVPDDVLDDTDRRIAALVDSLVGALAKDSLDGSLDICLDELPSEATFWALLLLDARFASSTVGADPQSPPCAPGTATSGFVHETSCIIRL